MRCIQTQYLRPPWRSGCIGPTRPAGRTINKLSSRSGRFRSGVWRRRRCDELRARSRRDRPLWSTLATTQQCSFAGSLARHRHLRFRCQTKEIQIWSSSGLTAEPVAMNHLPVRLPYGHHSCWAPNRTQDYAIEMIWRQVVDLLRPASIRSQKG